MKTHLISLLLATTLLIAGQARGESSESQLHESDSATFVVSTPVSQVLQDHLDGHVMRGAILFFGSMAGAGAMIYLGLDPVLAATMAPGAIMGALELSSATSGLEMLQATTNPSRDPQPIITEGGK